MATSIVLFDLGNVLATWDVGPRLAESARLSGLSPSEVLKRLSEDEFWSNTDRGLYSATEMGLRICQLLECKLSRTELLRLQALAFNIRPDVLSLAKAAAIKHQVGILTNNAPLLEEAIPLFFPELLESFDPILFSFQFGHVKPRHELFESVAERLGLCGAEIYFIDDTQDHVTAARATGWRAVQYQSAAQLRISLIEDDIIDDTSVRRASRV